jgi:hypothetical protein
MRHDRDEAIERAIDEYQQGQRKWLRQQLESEYVLHELKRLNHGARSALVEHFLKENDAEVHLQSLVQKGCNRRHIIDLLVMMDSDDVPPRWLGMRSRVELKRAVAKLREAEKIVRSIQPKISIVTNLSHTWAWFALFPLLPNLLESYCTFLQFFADSDESHPDAPRQLLVAHVMEQVGTPCDKEVAALIAALPGRAGYSAEAHAKWRNRQDIEECMQSLQRMRSDREH